MTDSRACPECQSGELVVHRAGEWVCIRHGPTDSAPAPDRPHDFPCNKCGTTMHVKTRRYWSCDCGGTQATIEVTPHTDVPPGMDALAAREQKLAVAQSMLDRAREREAAHDEETRVLRDALRELMVSLDQFEYCPTPNDDSSVYDHPDFKGKRAKARAALAALPQLQTSGEKK